MEGETTETPEINLLLVENWIDKIAKEGKVDEIDPALLSASLEQSGGNFGPSPELRYLAEYTNMAKRLGLDAVWGRARVDDYITWAGDFVKSYEQKAGPLPMLGRSKSKVSGMIQFFGELTAFAAGKMSFTDFKKYTQIRAENGRLWALGRKNERIRTSVPTSKSAILISSFPPGFVSAAWEKITSWGK